MPNPTNKGLAEVISIISNGKPQGSSSGQGSSGSSQGSSSGQSGQVVTDPSGKPVNLTIQPPKKS